MQPWKTPVIVPGIHVSACLFVVGQPDCDSNPQRIDISGDSRVTRLDVRRDGTIDYRSGVLALFSGARAG